MEAVFFIILAINFFKNGLHKTGSYMDFHSCLETFAFVVAALSLFLNYWENRRAHRLTFFSEYTRRFQEIMVEMPFEVFGAGFDPDKLDEPERKKLASQMLAYFSLCSEEYDLYTDGYVKKRIWKMWEEGIIENLKMPGFVWGWEQVESRFLFFDRYRIWVRQWLPNKGNPSN